MEPIYGVSLGYFLWSLALGAAAGVFYDLFRIKRRIIHTPGLAVIVEDIIYFILTGVAVFFIAYIKNSGQLRWQGLIGICGGFILYRLILRDKMVEISVKFIYFIVRLVKWLIKILVFPFRFIYRYLLYPLIFRPILWIGGQLRRSVGHMAQKCRNLFAHRPRDENGEETEDPPEEND